MRIVHTDDIIKNIKEMCIEANLYLTKDIEEAVKCSVKSEKSPLGQQILGQLEENLEIAKVDADRNLILIKGAIPGAKGAVVSICSAVKA